MRAFRNLAPVIAGSVLGLAAWLRLTSALQQVPNRHALNWDSARRAMLDVGAADALRTHHPWDFFVAVAGPETWPTLRLAVAAPLHALAGPGRALSVENGLSIALTALLFVALGFAARQLARSPTEALLVLGVSAAVLMSARALFVHSANGMLEVPSALLTLAAATAWLAARDRPTARPWAVALLGNLLFHVRWQHGLIFAAAVLLTEVGWGNLPKCARAVIAALGRGAKSRSGATLLVTAAALGATCAWVRVSGGGEVMLLGRRLSVRSADGPFALGSLVLFGYLQLSFWRDRFQLSQHVDAGVRFLWTWLLTPMVAWLLIPFTWRLRTLQRISAYDMVPPPVGLVGRLLFYPQAAWEVWSPGSVRWVVALLLAATVIAAWRTSAVRRQMLPLGILCALELVALLVLSRRNYQQRFLLNLVPVAALAAAAWIPAIRHVGFRSLLALSTTAALIALAGPSWLNPPLSKTLSEGFLDAETGDACRAVAEALPFTNGVLLNETSLVHRQTCAMWVTFLARERGADVDVRATRPRAQWREALLLTEGCEALSEPEGFRVAGSEFRSGPLCGQRYVARSTP